MCVIFYSGVEKRLIGLIKITSKDISKGIIRQQVISSFITSSPNCKAEAIGHSLSIELCADLAQECICTVSVAILHMYAE